MGFIKAFTGALSSTFAEQWQDYYMPRKDVTSTTAFCQAVRVDGAQNVKGNSCVISDGSKIIVPENWGLVTVQDGAITGFIAEAGGYEFRSNDPNSQSFLAGDNIFKTLWQSTWERFKFGGQIAAQQLAFYVNLQVIQGISYGSQSTIYWYDTLLKVQAGATAHGTYSLQVIDPMLFVKNFVPAEYKMDGAKLFDFNDVDNDKANNLITQFNTGLQQGMAEISTQAATAGIPTMVFMKGKSLEVCNILNTTIEQSYQWQSVNGFRLSQVAINMNYDAKTQAIQDKAQELDLENSRKVDLAAQMGSAYSNNMAGMMAAGSVEAMKTAAGNENGAMMGFMGMNMAQQNSANVTNGFMGTNPSVGVVAASEDTAEAVKEVVGSEDPYDKLAKLKKLADDGVISQEEFEQAKKNLLGI